MSDLISRQDAIETLTKANLQKHMDSVQDGGQENRSAIRIIMELPTADVVERKKGEWLFNPSEAIEMMFTKPKCSECGFESADGGNYCPNCGADMRKEVKSC